jgi:hypothetical protein
MIEVYTGEARCGGVSTGLLPAEGLTAIILWQG